MDKEYSVVILLSLIIICASVLVYVGKADWKDLYTIFLIVLAGLGFGIAGTYYGEAKAYREALEMITRASQEAEKEEEKGETVSG